MVKIQKISRMMTVILGMYSNIVNCIIILNKKGINVINVKKNAVKMTALVFGLLLLFITYSLTGKTSILVGYFVYVTLLLHHKKRLKEKAIKMSPKAHLKITIDELYNDERELAAIMGAKHFALRIGFIVLVVLALISVSFNRFFDRVITLSLTEVGLLLMVVMFITQVAYVARLFYELRD